MAGTTECEQSALTKVVMSLNGKPGFKQCVDLLTMAQKWGKGGTEPDMEKDVCPCFKYIPESVANQFACVVNKGTGTETVHALWQVCNSAASGRTETECAKENGVCKCSGIVRYGSGDKWTEGRAVSKSINCNNNVFGDPYHGVQKACMCLPAGKCDQNDFKTALAGLDNTVQTACARIATNFGGSATDQCKCFHLISANVAHLFHCKLSAGEGEQTVLDAWKACPGNKDKGWGPKCSNSNLLIVSETGKQLEDRNGKIGMHKDKGGWQKWTLSPAGDGKVFLTSHRGKHIADTGPVSRAMIALEGASSWKQERWKIYPAKGNCEVAQIGDCGGTCDDAAPRSRVITLKTDGMKCPTRVSRLNWLGTDTYGDV